MADETPDIIGPQAAARLDRLRKELREDQGEISKMENANPQGPERLADVLKAVEEFARLLQDEELA